jgi:8-oxo-dGTP pyrophosphatase MutT (NUDIX family)
MEPEELLDIIDENNTVIRQEPKTVAHEQGLRHRVAVVMLKRTSDNKYLFPTASDLKVEAGGLFHSAAGHITAGESYPEAALRELMEECGVQIDSSALTYLGTYWLEKDYPTRIERERFEIYEGVFPGGPVTFNDEQNNEQWLSMEELKDLYMKHKEKLSFPLQLTCEKVLGFLSR